MISEFEKRRKLGFIKCDRLYYYKSAAGREIDLIFESENEINAIEIKNTLRPSSRDVRNLVEFSRSMKKKVKMFLFYPGGEYGSINEVQNSCWRVYTEDNKKGSELFEFPFPKICRSERMRGGGPTHSFD